jgi:hypothetical protein
VNQLGEQANPMIVAAFIAVRDGPVAVTVTDTAVVTITL